MMLQTPLLNPCYYPSRAWNNSVSMWGKVAVVTFYSFIWLFILNLGISLVVPTFGDGGCLFDVDDNEQYAKSLLITWMQGMHLNIIAMLVYANREGIQSWNILMVLLFASGSVVLHATWKNNLSDTDMERYGSCIMDLMNAFYISLVWLGVALVCAVLEERAAANKKAAAEVAEEQQPLNK